MLWLFFGATLSQHLQNPLKIIFRPAKMIRTGATIPTNFRLKTRKVANKR